MGRELEGERTQGFGRCVECEAEYAVLIGESGDVVTPHGDCTECGGDEFEEVDEGDLDELSETEDWAN
jgi:hypothetical protein